WMSPANAIVTGCPLPRRLTVVVVAAVVAVVRAATGGDDGAWGATIRRASSGLSTTSRRGAGTAPATRRPPNTIGRTRRRIRTIVPAEAFRQPGSAGRPVRSCAMRLRTLARDARPRADAARVPAPLADQPRAPRDHHRDGCGGAAHRLGTRLQ